MDSSGDLMPLPDANKKSPRVYTNLQNIDLDSITFANVQSTGNPIAVEEMNEDEMRRLVLVNLARLVCAGEWNGLLTAPAGGGDFNAEVPGLSLGAGASNARYAVGSYAPYGNGELSTFSFYTNDNGDKALYYPFIGNVTGTVSEFGINITSAAGSACNLLVGIYADSGDGTPGALQMEASFDVAGSGTGSVYQTSITGVVSDSITRGTNYWIGLCRDTTSIGFTLKTFSPTSVTNLAPVDAAAMTADDGVVLRTVNKPLDLAANETAANLDGFNDGKCTVTLKVT